MPSATGGARTEGRFAGGNLRMEDGGHVIWTAGAAVVPEDTRGIVDTAML